MLTKQRAIVWFLVVIVTIPGLVFAKREGRLIGRVVDPEGQPIEGANVTVTSKDVPGFNVVEVTDKKGIFKVDFEVVEVAYDYRFEKAGYQTVITSQQWNLVGTERIDFTMPLGETPIAEGVVPASTSQPAVQAYNDGVAAFEAKNYAAAQAKFEEAAEHAPELRQTWAALSVVHLEQGHFQQATESAERAMALGSTDEAVFRARWEAYRQLGDEAKTAEALEDLERTGRLTEEAKRVYNEGVALLKADDDEGAFARFQEAVTIDPNLEVALLAVATSGLKIGRNAESVAAAETILANDPQNEEAIRVRYNAALALGDEDMIVDALLDLAPVEFATARDGLWVLALAAYDADDLERARQRFEKVLEVDPNSARAHYFLGLILVSEGANAEARDHLARFLELAPEDPDAATASDLVGYLGGGS
jgi:tetratricopeptide (TPR) repeat protein